MAQAHSEVPHRSDWHPYRVLVFDSGIGGTTVRQELQALAPGLTVDYAADTGFFPYGDKSDEALQERLPRLARALCAAARPDAFVIACNTASTLALDEVRAALDIPVIGTVPAIKPAAQASRTGTIGLLATPGTLRRGYTAGLIAEFAAGRRVLTHGSLALVHLAEAHAAGEVVTHEQVRAALAPLFEQEGGSEIDQVVLACTHFPILRAALKEAAPHEVTLVDSGAAIARQTLRQIHARTPIERAGGPAVAYITRSAPEPRLETSFRRSGLARVISIEPG